MPMPLSLQQIRPLAQALAVRGAYHPDDVDDLVQLGLIAYHKAEQRHRRLRIPIRKPWALARTTVQRAIWEFNKHRPPTGIRLTDCDPAVLVDRGTQMELLELDDYFRALGQQCGARARLIAEQLFTPSGPTAEKVLLAIKQKRRQRGHRGMSPHHHVMVRKALGMYYVQWQNELRAVREFTRQWLAGSR